MPEQIKNTLFGLGKAPAMILGKIDRYLRATGMPPTKFGRLAVNDPRLVHDLRLGREPGRRMVARVEAFIAREQAR